MPKASKKPPPPRRARGEEIHVMATPSEKREMAKAAKLAGMPTSVWLRALGLAEARRLTKG